ncbi:cell envelope integrity protein TolA [Shinella sp. BYT-45]|uniref:cell envelope integrity protein TolA n=1 Tax=Shinella sp. BYT-45 TaxID=3377377 RepID=UPI00397F0639
MPPASALLLSLAVHAGAAAAITLLLAPVEPYMPEPQPMAIMVAFVADPDLQEDKPQEVRKGDRASLAPDDAAPEKNDLDIPDEAAKPDTLLELEELPDSVPVPVRRPKPERRTAEKKARDKTKLATAKGLEDEPRPDIPIGEDLRMAGEVDATLAFAASRGVRRNVDAQERWLARLSTHLERRKRYPRSSLSRREEGIVHVRFAVAPDGKVLMPEIVRSSGISALDEEVMALLERAAPLPKPPSDINTLVTVPVDFTIKR